jgi:hypothetical protein
MAINTKVRRLIESVVKFNQIDGSVLTFGKQKMLNCDFDSDHFFGLLGVNCVDSQARSGGQPVGGSFDTSNFKFLLPMIFAMFAHGVLYLSGVLILVVILPGFNKHYNTLSNFKGLFLCKNRSVWLQLMDSE